MPRFLKTDSRCAATTRSVGGVLKTQGVTGLVIFSVPAWAINGIFDSLAIGRTCRLSPELDGPMMTTTLSDSMRRRACWAALAVLPSVS